MTVKTYIGISRDHSGSMRSLARAAARDYNATIDSIRTESQNAGQDTIVSVVECASDVRRVVQNSSITALTPMNENSYQASGSTVLFDSVGDLIDQFERSPDAHNPNVGFMIMAITDGEENGSRRWNARTLMDKIRALQATDRWTFVFRVPRGYSRMLINLGVPQGNILEWDQSESGVQEATVSTRSAFTQYYTERAAGKTATKKFYSNLADVDIKVVKAALVDVSSLVNLWITPQQEVIKPFCEKMSKQGFIKGAAFYQLTKSEREVQDYKQIVIRDKQSGAVYGGAAARDLLGLPKSGTIPLHPGDHGQYDIYIQSTSVNRVLPAGTQLLYWPTWATPPVAGTPSTQAAKKFAALTASQAAGVTVAPVNVTVQAKKAPAAKKTVPTTVTQTFASALRDNEYIAGYKEGFAWGKVKSTKVAATLGSTPSYCEGYLAGYKDGRGKKKRLYK